MNYKTSVSIQFQFNLVQFRKIPHRIFIYIYYILFWWLFWFACEENCQWSLLDRDPVHNTISIQTKSLKPFRYFFSNEENVNINKHLISSYRMECRILYCVWVFLFFFLIRFVLLCYKIRKKGNNTTRMETHINKRALS